MSLVLKSLDLPRGPPSRSTDVAHFRLKQRFFNEVYSKPPPFTHIPYVHPPTLCSLPCYAVPSHSSLPFPCPPPLPCAVASATSARCCLRSPGRSASARAHVGPPASTASYTSSTYPTIHIPGSQDL